MRLDRGDHVFRLVVDALNQVSETDETDNTFEWTYAWGGDPLATPQATARAVNLAFEPADGRTEPVVAAASAGSARSGPLTVDGPTYISWGVGNAGLASTDSSISVHMYFDGILVEQRVVDGIAALSGAALTDWDELPDSIRITPGQHTLLVSIDPGNLVDESDETDNSLTSELTWSTGPATPPDPVPEEIAIPAPPYEELVRPNLAPYLPADWDGPLVIRGGSSGVTVEGRNGHVSAFTAGSVDYSVTNDSGVAMTNSFSARLLLDGLLVDETSFAAGGAAGVWVVDAAIPADRLTPGEHSLTVVIDAGVEVTESDESDNSLTVTFEAVAGPPPPPTAPVAYSVAELSAMLDIIPALVLETADVDAQVNDGTDWASIVLEAADAAYFLATGTAITDERVDISLLSRAEYESQNLSICLEDQNTLSSSQRDAELMDCRLTIGESAGLTWSGTGVIRVRIDMSATPAGVLTTLMHELGHARQVLLAPASGAGVQASSLASLREAQAQVFEAVGWRHIEEFLGETYTQFPDLAVLRDQVGDRLDRQLEKAAVLEEHGLGYELMWLAALQDPAGLGLATELRSNGKLSAASTKLFYDYLLSIRPEDTNTWVNARLGSGGSLVNEYRELALSRLVDGLPAESEGHPDLLDPGFLSP
ncbi:MAG: hypothetical protein O3C10_09045 [Chloroflexi bacterium]|nr:hypothetical protein [Chloroflexota bacterium]